MANFIAPLTPVGLSPFVHTGKARTLGYATTAELDTRDHYLLYRIRHHGSPIADIHAEYASLRATLIWVSNAGWDSMTTRDRIDEVLRANGVRYSVSQVQGIQVLFDRESARRYPDFREATFQLRHGEWQLTRFNAQLLEA
jgi:hypothetical protein